MQAAQASLKQSIGEQEAKPTSDDMRRLTLDGARSSLAIRGPKASKEETDAYRQLLYCIADKVAHAAREGEFLGFGGTLVSEGELSHCVAGALLVRLRDRPLLSISNLPKKMQNQDIVGAAAGLRLVLPPEI